MANGHSTDVRLKNNPYIQDLGGDYIRNADGQIVRKAVRKRPTTGITRFFQKVRVSEMLSYNDSPCWEWIGCKTKIGYGQFRVDGRRGAVLSSPHRFAYAYFVGPIPDSYEVDHLCKVRHCCNPLHLEAVPMEVNRKRRNADQTHCKNGHEFTAENVYMRSDGARRCRACNRERVKAFHARHPQYEKQMQFPCRQKRNNIIPDEDAT